VEVDVPAVPALARSSGDFLKSLLNSKYDLGLHRSFVGTKERHDGWSCTGRHVNGHWVLLVLEGECRGQAAGREFLLKPGMAVWIGHGQEHSMQWSRTIRFSEVYFLLAEEDRYLTVDVLPLLTTEASEIKPQLDRISTEVYFNETHHVLRSRSLLAGLLIDLIRIHDGRRRIRDAFSRSRREQLLHFTRENIGRKLMPSDLAAELGLSPDYFSRRFRATFGKSPRVWLAERKIEAAEDFLIRSNLSIYEISERLGYSESAQFSRQFKNITGLSPSEYREKH
jgi:AraC-like DNA-binding protein